MFRELYSLLVASIIIPSVNGEEPGEPDTEWIRSRYRAELPELTDNKYIVSDIVW